MIDTIVLTLRHNEFAILEHAKFSPSTAGLFQEPYYSLGRNGFIKCIQNPTKEDLESGTYKPRLTVTRRMGTKTFATTLRIEFSIPKLLFGNNFDEVTDKDFRQVLDRLRQRLQEMGILAVKPLLEEAPVSAIHYSKNIPLTDYSTPYAVLKELSKANMNQKLDLNQTDFRNEGHALKFRANSFEIVLYDKMKDLARAKISEKRAVERDYAIQQELFEEFKPKKPFEVLRLEIRLGNRAKLRQILAKLGLLPNMTFKALFRESISKKILHAYFEEIVGGCLLAPKPKSWKDFVWNFRMQNPKTKVRKMLQIAGTTAICQEIGLREFRETIRCYGPHHWPRLRKDLSALTASDSNHAGIQVIQEALKEFRPLKLADFANK